MFAPFAKAVRSSWPQGKAGSGEQKAESERRKAVRSCQPRAAGFTPAEMRTAPKRTTSVTVHHEGDRGRAKGDRGPVAKDKGRRKHGSGKERTAPRAERLVAGLARRSGRRPLGWPESVHESLRYCSLSEGASGSGPASLAASSFFFWRRARLSWAFRFFSISR